MLRVISSPRATLAASEFFIIDLMWFPCLAIPLPCQLSLYRSLARPRGLTGREPSPPFIVSHHGSTKPFPIFHPYHLGVSRTRAPRCLLALGERVVKRSMYWCWLSTAIKLNQPSPSLPCQSSRSSSGSVCMCVIGVDSVAWTVDIWQWRRQSRYPSAFALPSPVEAFKML